jgi:hypothetical protein
MNPPFTRTCGDNLLFGSLPETERTRMQKAFQEWCKQHGVEASITAGLGAPFLAAADRCLKPDGRLAFVLPKTLLSGPAWQKSRELLRRNYTLEYLIVSHDPTRWHFSENTDLSETLFVARKASDGGGTLCLNLWRNPDNPCRRAAARRRGAQTRPRRRHAPDLRLCGWAIQSGARRSTCLTRTSRAYRTGCCHAPTPRER